MPSWPTAGFWPSWPAGLGPGKPLSRGGEHTWDNVVSACRRCNHRKGSRLPWEAGMYPRHVPKRPDMVQVAWAGRLTHPLQRQYVAQWHKVPEAVL